MEKQSKKTTKNVHQKSMKKTQKRAQNGAPNPPKNGQKGTTLLDVLGPGCTWEPDLPERRPRDPKGSQNGAQMAPKLTKSEPKRAQKFQRLPQRLSEHKQRKTYKQYLK